MTDKSLCDSCINIGCEFQSGIVRTKCDFYMPPQLEPDNCGNYVVQDSTTKNDIRDNRVKNELNRVKDELEPTTKNCELCRYYGLHHEVCNYCYKCSLWTEQEPTTKNDLAVEKTDMIDKSNFSQEQYKTDLQSAYDSGYEQAKNDLEVDWESYKDVDGNSLDDLILDVIQRNFDCGNTYGYKVADEIIGLLPSVTPQEPNTWSLDDAREDFMHDVYNELDFLPTNEEANRIIDIFDRVTSSIEQEPKWIPVTERLPKEVNTYEVTLRGIGELEGIDNEVAYATWLKNRKEWLYHDIDDWKDKEVIAWMPLPQPYKGGQKDGKA